MDVCAEKFHRAPEECAHISMDTIWEVILIDEERAAEIEGKAQRK